MTIASMLINDYFDWASGADVVNAPHKPLPAGLVLPDRAVLVAAGVYMAVLTMACLIPSPALRAITAFSAGMCGYAATPQRANLFSSCLSASCGCSTSSCPLLCNTLHPACFIH